MYGIKVRNDGNYIKIDQDSEQLIVVGSGTTVSGSLSAAGLEGQSLFPITKIYVSPVNYMYGDRYITAELYNMGLYTSTLDLTPYGGSIMTFYKYQLAIWTAKASNTSTTASLSQPSGYGNFEPFHYILMSRIKDVDDLNDQYPEFSSSDAPRGGYGFEVYESDGIKRVFTSSAKYAEIMYADVQPKSQFTLSKDIILPASSRRRYLDISPFVKTHYNGAGGERFSLKAFRFESASKIVTRGFDYNQGFQVNNTRTDPGHTDKTILIAESSING